MMLLWMIVMTMMRGKRTLTRRMFWFSLRAMFGTDEERNAVHGSGSSDSAEREIRFFFPDGELFRVEVSK